MLNIPIILLSIKRTIQTGNIRAEKSGMSHGNRTRRALTIIHMSRSGHSYAKFKVS